MAADEQWHPARDFEDHHIHPALERRKDEGSLRKLTPYFPDNVRTSSASCGSSSSSSSSSSSAFIDFSSNDYLGLAQSSDQNDKVEAAYKKLTSSLSPSSSSSPSLPIHEGSTDHVVGATIRRHRLRLLGSTGSRLLTGDTTYAHQLEQSLAAWHRREAALICNSGYDANLAVLSCLGFHSTVIMDELAHNSLHMGVRSSRDCVVRIFQHNSLDDLERQLQQAKKDQQLKNNTHGGKSNSKPPLIVVESVYSMDGDAAPLTDILELALRYRACVVVDEAHGLGVYGPTGMGMIEEYRLEDHPALLCSIHTFGKAAGCHGAVVCGSQSLKQYLYNFGRPIVYSTSLPLHALVTIECSYQTMRNELGSELRRKGRELVRLFRSQIIKALDHARQNASNHDNRTNANLQPVSLVPSDSPIQALIVPGNKRCVEFCNRLWETSQKTIRLYPIRSPTVPKGQERVRVIIHSHNTEDEVRYLVKLIEKTISHVVVVNGGLMGRAHTSDKIMSKL